MKRIIAMLLVAVMVLSLVACDLGALGGAVSSSQKEEEKEYVKVTFKAFEPGAVIIGASILNVEKGSDLDWTRVPEASLQGCEFIGWAYDINGDRMLDIVSDEFNSDTVLVAIFAPITDGDSSQSQPNGETAGSDGISDDSGDTVDSSTNESDVVDTDESGVDSDVVDTSTSDSDAVDTDESDVDSDAVDTDESDIDSDVVDSSTNESGAVDTDESTTDSSDTDDSGNIDPEEMVCVDFRPGSSKAVVEGDKTLTIAKGSKLTIEMAPTVTLEGYTFKGWSFIPVDPDFWDGAEITVNFDLIFYAVWEKNPDDTTDSSEPTADSKPDDDIKDEIEKVTIKFALRGGVIIDGEIEVEIVKGSYLNPYMAPEVEKAGYVFKGWAYDRSGNEPWYEDDPFEDDTTLYAQWEEKSADDTTDSSTTDSSVVTPPATDDDVIANPVIIEYNTGTGYFEDDSNYEITIEYNTRFTKHPTPIHDNLAMLFVGWYTDSACTKPVSNSTKYTNDVTMLYAKWQERTQCVDGSYDHRFSSWDNYSAATCTQAGVDVRYCMDCNWEEKKAVEAALGHKFGPWQESFMAKERICQRLGCNETETLAYENVTVKVLGKNPSNNISGNTEAFYNVPFTNLINGNWSEGYGQMVCPRGTGDAYVIFELEKATSLDRIYFRGVGNRAITILVQYEEDNDYTILGLVGGADNIEDTPFVEPNTSKKVVRVKFLEENPPQATSYWYEIAFAKLPGDDTVEDDTVVEDKPTDGKITISYDVGVGYFENIDDYEKVIDYGARFPIHPIPVSDDPAMRFEGWYYDEAFTNPVIMSMKYTQSFTLYARWIEQVECLDGSYDHEYSAWEEYTVPTCIAPGVVERYCMVCNFEERKVGDPALGHKFGQWTEAFMAKERTCQRLGCGEKEVMQFSNITTFLLGNNPADQIDANQEAFYSVPFTNLINNRWDEGHGAFISPRGTGLAYIQFNFVEATAIDRVYFNGSGVTSINTYVLYEGDDEFTLIGIMGGVSEKEDTPFAETDPTRKVVAVKFVEEYPPQGTSCWREVAFVKIAE